MRDLPTIEEIITNLETYSKDLRVLALEIRIKKTDSHDRILKMRVKDNENQSHLINIIF